MNKLLEFESIQRCPKCGADRDSMWVEYHSGNSGSGHLWWRVPPVEERMLIMCPHCKYFWSERPLDAGSVKKPRRRRGSVKRNGGD